MRREVGIVAATVLGMGASCGSSRSEDSVGLSGGGNSASGTETADDGGPADGGDGDGNSDGGPGDDGFKFDTPDGADGVTPGDGCEKVDFLFVIDNSGSMQRSQEELIGSFPGFMEAIRDNIKGQDYHIMVVDSDSTGDCACGPFTELAQYCDEMVLQGCDSHCGMCPFEGGNCDNVLGAGTVKSSPETGAVDCGIAGGNRYIIDGQPDLDATFACMAEVGTQGDWNERPMRGTVRALDAERNGPGGCNEGFVRDDAILVVTIVSDAGPNTANMEHSRGSAEEWYDGVVAAKHGDPSAIVAVGFMGDSDLPTGHCIQPDQRAPEYREFIQMFGTRGFLSSTCIDSYAPLFAEAVSTIDQTCDEFTPEG